MRRSTQIFHSLVKVTKTEKLKEEAMEEENNKDKRNKDKTNKEVSTNKEEKMKRKRRKKKQKNIMSNNLSAAAYVFDQELDCIMTNLEGLDITSHNNIGSSGCSDGSGASTPTQLSAQEKLDISTYVLTQSWIKF